MQRLALRREEQKLHDEKEILDAVRYLDMILIWLVW